MYGTQFLGNCVTAKSLSVSPALATTDAHRCLSPLLPYQPHLSPPAQPDGPALPGGSAVAPSLDNYCPASPCLSSTSMAVPFAASQPAAELALHKECAPHLTYSQQRQEADCSMHGTDNTQN